MTLIPILLMITTIINKNMCMNNSKNGLQNIRNLEDDSDEIKNTDIESDESSDESYESSENSIEDNSESMMSSFEGNDAKTQGPEMGLDDDYGDNSDKGIEDTEVAGVNPENNANETSVENEIQFAVLYAIDNFSFRNHKIFFYIYIFFHGYYFSESFPVPNIRITIIIIFYRLRLLSETREIITCSQNTHHGELYRYSCELVDDNINSISKIEGVSIESNNSLFKIDNTTSSLAEFKDITNQTMDRIQIEKGFVYIRNCEFISKEPVIQIKGETADVQNNVGLTLDIKSYDGFVKVDSNLLLKNRLLRTLEGERNVVVQLNAYKPLSANLNKTAGVLDDGRNALIHFKKGVDSTVYYSPDTNNFFMTKKTKGLSGGSIAAIVITIVAVLIAVIAIAFIMMKKPVLPPNRMSGSVEAGYEMSSSTNAIN